MVTHIVGVRVSGEDWTCSLTSVGASILDEEHTWSLRFTRVPFSGEDCSWSATPQPTPVYVKVQTRDRLCYNRVLYVNQHIQYTVSHVIHILVD